MASIGGVMLTALLVVYLIVNMLNEPEELPQRIMATDIIQRWFDDRDYDEVPELVHLTVNSFDALGRPDTLVFSREKLWNGNFTDWVLVSYPDMVLSDFNTNDLLSTYVSLFAQVITETPPEDLTMYGFGTDTTAYNTAIYEDGTVLNFQIGTPTPSGDAFYILFHDDPTLYTVITYQGEKMRFTLTDVVSKTISPMYLDSLSYLYIDARDKPIIEIYDLTFGQSNFTDDFDNPIFPLAMSQPYSGWDVGSMQLIEYVFNRNAHDENRFWNLNIHSLHEYNAQDLSQYGFDSPLVDLRLRIGFNDPLRFVIGDVVPFDDTLYFMLLGDSNHVYTIRNIFFNRFLDINVFNFVTRYIHIDRITELDSVELIHDGETNVLTFNHTTYNLRDNQIRPMLNGIPVYPSTASKFYETLLLLRVDTDIKSEFVPSDEHVIEIRFIYRENSETGNDIVTVKFFDYDTNFYAVQKDNGSIDFIIGKRNFDIFFQAFDDMVNGVIR
jgi:hypothetical protein